jgi:hypothetical protein
MIRWVLVKPSLLFVPRLPTFELDQSIHTTDIADLMIGLGYSLDRLARSLSEKPTALAGLISVLWDPARVLPTAETVIDPTVVNALKPYLAFGGPCREPRKADALGRSVLMKQHGAVLL